MAPHTNRRKSVAARAAVVILAALVCPSMRAQQPAADGLRRGLELYRGGDCPAARRIFADILQREPQNLTVHKMMADCLTQEHRTEEARQEYETILRIAPGDPDATQALHPEPVPAVQPKPAPAPPANTEVGERVRAGGEIESAEREIQAGRLDQAITLLNALHSRMPSLVLPQQRLAEIYTRTKQYTAAADIYSALAAAPGGSAVFLQRAAQNFAFAEKYPDAVRFYGQYLALRPGDVAASLELANVLLWSNQLAEAVVAYRHYLDQRPDDFEAGRNLGNALLWSKQFQEALDELNRLTARRPRDSDLLFSTAQCYDQMGKYDQALALYDRVLQIKPGDSPATEARNRLVSEMPRLNATARVAQQDYKGALELFLAYLDKHPESTDTLLQLARVSSWDKQYVDSAKYYDLYLQKVPTDRTAVRELAKVELTIPSFARARQDFQLLTSDPRATVDDYEGLVHAFVWDDKLALAQAPAKMLLQFDPSNAVALEAVRPYETQQKAAEMDKARILTASGNYEEAISTYQRYAASYGTSRELALALARLYGWNKQYQESILRYRNYLQQYQDDAQAHLELADNEKFNKKFDAAEADYAAVLRTNPQNQTLRAQADLGLAQTKDYRGEDPFEVVQAYRQVLNADAANAAAQERIEELGPQVSPSISIRDNTFSDSDGFGRSLNGLELTFPLAAGLRITPFGSYDYFDQSRQVGGASCGAPTTVVDPKLLSLSSQICGLNGTTRGAGGGMRIGLDASTHVSLMLEAADVLFNNTRTDLQLRGGITVRGAGDKVLSMTYVRRNAAYDVNTIFPLFADVIGQNGFVSYQQPISERWGLWLGGGLERYSGGVNNISPVNTQKIFSARADYKILPSLSAGYFARVTTFSATSPLYFSPSDYGVFGVEYDVSKAIAPNFKLHAAGDLGYGRIDRYSVAGVGTVEVSVFPEIIWKIRPDLELHLGYRFGCGSTSAFNAPGLRTCSASVCRIRYAPFTGRSGCPYWNARFYYLEDRDGAAAAGALLGYGRSLPGLVYGGSRWRSDRHGRPKLVALPRLHKLPPLIPVIANRDFNSGVSRRPALRRGQVLTATRRTRSGRSPERLRTGYGVKFPRTCGAAIADLSPRWPRLCTGSICRRLNSDPGALDARIRAPQAETSGQYCGKPRRCFRLPAVGRSCGF